MQVHQLKQLELIQFIVNWKTRIYFSYTMPWKMRKPLIWFDLDWFIFSWNIFSLLHLHWIETHGSHLNQICYHFSFVVFRHVHNNFQNQLWFALKCGFFKNSKIYFVCNTLVTGKYISARTLASYSHLLCCIVQ